MQEISKENHINEEFTKETRINKELTRISLFFEEVDANQKAIVAPLLQNAAFMKVTLEDLKEVINTEGVTEEYQNGANQRGVKQSAALQSYNSLIKNYASVIKTLSQLLPPERKATALSSLQIMMPIEKTEEELEAERREREEEADYWAKEAGKIRRYYEEKEKAKAGIT